MLVLLVLPCAWGQYYEPPPMNPDPTWQPGHAARPGAAVPTAGRPAVAANQQALVPREQTRVAVLGYHNFSETKPVTEMLMRTSEFRRQMEYIRRAGLRVISLQEFMDWRLGELQLPERCVLITLDDGWRSVYTDAYPILKEYGYPFTLFLYTKYLTGRGDSMTPAMIREMQAHGATIGSHSTSHLYPKSWRTSEAQGAEAHAALMDEEMGGSLKRLSELFGPISTYCYPGGYVTPAMQERLPSYGYVAAFGIKPGKVGCTEDVWQIHRYMIFGNNGSIFERAMDFDNRPDQAGSPTTSLVSSAHAPAHPVFPQPGATVPSAVPVISAQLGGIEGVDYSSVRMSVSGFGRVPARVDASSGAVQWTPPYRIYLPTLTVQLTWKNYNGTPHKSEWSFRIDSSVNIEP